jgi:hypothetical protein
MTFSITLFALATVVVLAACATSGHVDSAFTPNQTNKTIFVSEHQSENEARHIKQVIRTFEKYGFDVGKDKRQAAYYLDFSITGGLVVTVEISLLSVADNKTMLTVSSTNTGWGTVIARPIAIAGRVSEALRELDELLAHHR